MVNICSDSVREKYQVKFSSAAQKMFSQSDPAHVNLTFRVQKIRLSLTKRTLYLHYEDNAVIFQKPYETQIIIFE
jgi:hypothetical protein